MIGIIIIGNSSVGRDALIKFIKQHIIECQLIEDSRHFTVSTNPAPELIRIEIPNRLVKNDKELFPHQRQKFWNEQPNSISRRTKRK